jgi:hypothetical protein
MARGTKYRAMVRGVIALGLYGSAACLLADPPAALPIAPFTPIRILRESVTPPVSLLTSLPGEFVVPMTADLRKGALQYEFFSDQVGSGQHRQEIGTDGGVLVTVPDPLNFVAEECHTLELRVSYLDSTGGDSISWFYSPTGSFSDCPVFDARPPDAGDAASDDGSGGGG